MDRNCTSSSARGMWPDVAAAPTAIHVGIVDAVEGAGTGTGGGDDVGRGGDVVLGATVEAAVALKMSTALE
jgi:hypothetical protein